MFLSLSLCLQPSSRVSLALSLRFQRLVGEVEGKRSSNARYVITVVATRRNPRSLTHSSLSFSLFLSLSPAQLSEQATAQRLQQLTRSRSEIQAQEHTSLFDLSRQMMYENGGRTREGEREEAVRRRNATLPPFSSCCYLLSRKTIASSTTAIPLLLSYSLSTAAAEKCIIITKGYHCAAFAA